MAWQRLHPVLGFSMRGQRLQGLVRGQSMVTVLRDASPSEVLQHGVVSSPCSTPHLDVNVDTELASVQLF